MAGIAADEAGYSGLGRLRRSQRIALNFGSA